ncbi:MAG: Lar family restriction alleviation protein [Candidatus Andersenbacteria bacterium]
MTEELKPISEFTLTLIFKVFPDNEIVVECSEFPEVVTAGNNLESALDMGIDAIKEAIAGRRNHNKKLPWEDKLKSCPFCRGAAELLSWEDKMSSYDVNWSVSCFDCGVEMPSTATESKAVKLWNKRVENDSKTS